MVAAAPWCPSGQSVGRPRAAGAAASHAVCSRVSSCRASSSSSPTGPVRWVPGSTCCTGRGVCLSMRS
eukprot:14595471-Heterocapsa_arctica.AAC.1